MPNGPRGESERGPAHVPLPQPGADTGGNLRQPDRDAAGRCGHGELSALLSSQQSTVKAGGLSEESDRWQIL